MKNGRILFVDEAHGFGGSIVALARCTPGLAARGFEIHAVLTADDPRSIEALRGAGATVHVLPLPHRPEAVDRRLATLGRWFWPAKATALLGRTLVEGRRRKTWLAHLAGLIRAIRPAVLHANNGPAFNAEAMLLADSLAVPVVATVRGGSTTLGRGRQAAQKAHRLIFISEHMRRACGAAEDPAATVIYDGLDLDQFPPPAENRLAARIDKPVRFIHAGMFIPWKGQELYLRAAEIVAARNPQVEFYLCGSAVSKEEHAYEAFLRSLAGSKNLSEKVHFLGFRPQITPIFEDMDVLVHCSTAPEPFGLVVLEAMACGLAVIAPVEGGPAEILRHAVDGLLVAPNDAARLAESMEQLRADRPRIESMGRAGRDRVRRDFPLERTVQRLDELYRSL